MGQAALGRSVWHGMHRGVSLVLRASQGGTERERSASKSNGMSNRSSMGGGGGRLQVGREERETQGRHKTG